MKVLVVGGGGREHALCWKLRQSPDLKELYCAPGNPGIGEIADLVPMAAEEVHRLADFALGLKIDLTVVGPELPLSLGLADELRARGLDVFGPSRAAAEIEASKVFAKQFMQRHEIPTADFVLAHDAGEAERAAAHFGLPVVLKADGLASGKGVFVVQTAEELEEAFQALFEERRFGTAGERVIVEQFLVGEEISFIAISDGERLLPFATSKDYKRVGDGDTGPNTGGMGAHSPSGVLSPREGSLVVERILQPAIAGLAAENRPFVGVLYAGLILTEEGPKVLEFNARFGDPEAQVLMLRLENDLLPVLAAGAAGNFGAHRLRFKKEAAACVVLAAAGYPGKPTRGEVITGLEAASALPGVEIFHAATAEKDALLLTAGGRVLNVCAQGPRLVDALRRAYQAVGMVRFPNKVFRTDIGRRVLETIAQRRGASGLDGD
ncbi:MAG TPA: phosphoribosylamine--glycine ligase [Thermoanaerobaculia bacterium]|nr:phosphoribosylamine--glycine ligase [Thermoanaerobaculia bacterium]